MLRLPLTLALLGAAHAALPDARPPRRLRAPSSSARSAAPAPLSAAYRDPDVLSQQMPLPLPAFPAPPPVAAAQQDKVAALQIALEQARADLNHISSEMHALLTSVEPPALVADALGAPAAEAAAEPAWEPMPAPPAPTRSVGAPDISVRIVGVGGSGGNTLNRLAPHVAPYGPAVMRTLAINTDRQVLEASLADETMLVAAPPDAAGGRRHLGQGAGGDPTVGAAAARAHAADVDAALEGADMVFVTGGMGGGTGSGAAPEVARLARERGALTVGVVTRPFGFEGTRRREAAERAIEALAAETDALVVISNDRLLSQLPEGTSVTRAFAAADDVLRQAICAVAEIVLDTGLINVDFNDLRAVMCSSGPALVGIGVADGSAAEAARAAIACPLLETAAADAQGIVFNVCGGTQLSLREVHAASDAISAIAHPDANIIFGARAGFGGTRARGRLRARAAGRAGACSRTPPLPLTRVLPRLPRRCVSPLARRHFDRREPRLAGARHGHRHLHRLGQARPAAAAHRARGGRAGAGGCRGQGARGRRGASRKGARGPPRIRFPEAVVAVQGAAAPGGHALGRVAGVGGGRAARLRGHQIASGAWPEAASPRPQLARSHTSARRPPRCLWLGGRTPGATWLPGAG